MGGDRLYLLGHSHIQITVKRYTDRLDYITDLVDRLDLFRQIEQHL